MSYERPPYTVAEVPAMFDIGNSQSIFEAVAAACALPESETKTALLKAIVDAMTVMMHPAMIVHK